MSTAERETTDLKVSDIVPEKKIHPLVRLRRYAEQVSDENRLDHDSSYALVKYANTYFRLTEVRNDFNKSRQPWIGYPIEFGQNGQPINGKFEFITLHRSDDYIYALSNTAFNIWRLYLGKTNRTKRAVNQVKDYVEFLFN